MVSITMGEEVWVIAGLGSVTGDLPQGNVHASVKSHSSQFSCKSCMRGLQITHLTW